MIIKLAQTNKWKRQSPENDPEVGFWKIIPLFGDSLESMCPVDYDRGVVLAAGLWLLLMIFVSSPPLSGVDY